MADDLPTSLVDDALAAGREAALNFAGPASLVADAAVRAALAAVLDEAVAFGRQQALAVLRDDGLYAEWERRWGIDPAGPRSHVPLALRHVMRDFAEWATNPGRGGE